MDRAALVFVLGPIPTGLRGTAPVANGPAVCVEGPAPMAVDATGTQNSQGGPVACCLPERCARAPRFGAAP
eukprot:8456754-Lingulodinium_polyedra.AAC.1